MCRSVEKIDFEKNISNRKSFVRLPKSGTASKSCFHKQIPYIILKLNNQNKFYFSVQGSKCIEEQLHYFLFCLSGKFAR